VKPLPIGLSDYKEIIQGNYTYVDKTLFIQELLSLKSKVFLLPRPRRFGKTINLSMCRYFFEKTQEDHGTLFHKHKIWKTKHKCEQGKYPVIFLTLKEVKGTSWNESYEDLKVLIRTEFNRHSYLLTAKHPCPTVERREKGAALLLPSERTEFLAIVDGSASPAYFKHSLKSLTLWLQRYYQEQVFVFLDEYDAPIHAAYVEGYYKTMINFLRSWLGGGLKDNPCLKQAIITGILRTGKESIFSGLNHFGCHTLLGKHFCDKFGLLEKEVRDLLKEHQIATPMQKIREWYNGYHVGSYALYNPWSIMQCIENHGDLQAYWINTSDNDLIKRHILQGPVSVKKDMEFLLQGQAITKPLDESLVFSSLLRDENALWSLLFFSGYLTLAGEPHYEDADLLCPLRAPNQEILRLYATVIKSWFRESLSTQDQQQVLLQSLVTGDIETFTTLFQELIKSCMSYFDIPANEPERMYHVFVLGLLVFLRPTHEVLSNRESGLGRYDVCLIPKNKKALGIVMEFKKSPQGSLKEAAKEALRQIKNKDYALELKERGIHQILGLGLAFRKKQVCVAKEWLR